jgi:hypothetical protein
MIIRKIKCIQICKVNQQGNAAFNERNLQTTKQQEPEARSPENNKQK